MRERKKDVRPGFCGSGSRAAAALALGAMAVSCQPAGSGEPVGIPSVTLNCSTGPCATANGSRSFVMFVTAAGCANPEFDARLSAAGTVNCSGGACTGVADSWASASGRETTIAASNYDFCAFIYFNGNPSGDPISGDARGALERVTVDGSQGSLSQTMRSWTPLP